MGESEKTADEVESIAQGCKGANPSTPPAAGKEEGDGHRGDCSQNDGEEAGFIPCVADDRPKIELEETLEKFHGAALDVAAVCAESARRGRDVREAIGIVKRGNRFREGHDVVA